MKLITVLSVLVIPVLLSQSCKKDDSPSSYSDKIVLNNLEMTNNSIKLSWTKLDNSKFISYYVIRRDFKGTNSLSYSDLIKVISDPDLTTYTDEEIPYTPYLEYQVVGAISTGDPQNPTIVYSNIKSYERPDIKIFSFALTDIIPDLQNNILYIFESDSGKISRLNFESGTIEKTIITNATIGFGDLGLINNVWQIVVPRNDGWIFFYDAATLSKTDQINYGGTAASAVLNDNKVFVSGESSTSWYESVGVFDCETRELISETSVYDLLRLKHIPGSHSKFYGISSSSYSELYSFQFDNSGNYMSQMSNNISYSTDDQIFRLFPDGNHFITSRDGVVVDKDLNYTVTLPHGNYTFSDFEFSENSGLIYCACSNFKKVLAFANPGYNQVQEFNTTGYPARIFRKGNELICLSMTDPFSYFPSYYPESFLLERIPLN
jgi:hypothetical protein